VPVFLPKEPPRKELQLTAVLYALSDEVRLGIVRQLAKKGEQSCGVFEVDRPKSSLSHHFRVLRESEAADEFAAERGSGGAVSWVVEGSVEVGLARVQ
jgi:DNA-binding transcriptional ArsR family regulator